MHNYVAPKNSALPVGYFATKSSKTTKYKAAKTTIFTSLYPLTFKQQATMTMPKADM